MTVLWLLAVANVVNFMDGLDAIAGTTCAVAFGLALGVAGGSEVGEGAAVWGAALGAVLGFLAWNAPPARIFMGDGGSHALGFLVAATVCRVGRRGPRGAGASARALGPARAAPWSRPSWTWGRRCSTRGATGSPCRSRTTTISTSASSRRGCPGRAVALRYGALAARGASRSRGPCRRPLGARGGPRRRARRSSAPHLVDGGAPHPRRSRDSRPREVPRARPPRRSSRACTRRSSRRRSTWRSSSGSTTRRSSRGPTTTPPHFVRALPLAGRPAPRGAPALRAEPRAVALRGPLRPPPPRRTRCAPRASRSSAATTVAFGWKYVPHSVLVIDAALAMLLLRRRALRAPRLAGERRRHVGGRRALVVVGAGDAGEAARARDAPAGPRDAGGVRRRRPVASGARRSTASPSAGRVAEPRRASCATRARPRSSSRCPRATAEVARARRRGRGRHRRPLPRARPRGPRRRAPRGAASTSTSPTCSTRPVAALDEDADPARTSRAAACS